MSERLPHDRVHRLARSISGRDASRSAVRLPRCAGPAGPPIRYGLEGALVFETFSEVVSHASVDQKFVFRLLRDKSSGRLDAFLMHPEKNLYRFARVRLSGIPAEFITDSHGRFSLDRSGFDFGRTTVMIVPPFAVYRCRLSDRSDRLELRPEFAVPGRMDTPIHLSYADGGSAKSLVVRVPAFEAARGGEKIALIADGEEIRMAVPQKGTAVFEDPGVRRELQINLYE